MSERHLNEAEINLKPEFIKFCQIYKPHHRYLPQGVDKDVTQIRISQKLHLLPTTIFSTELSMYLRVGGF